MTKLTSITALLLFLATDALAEGEAGKTMIARGPVEALSSDDQNTRKLRRRSPIFGSDTVTTGDNGKAQLRMRDGGMIALKENSELFIADYNFSEDNGRGNVVMELVKGGLRSVTGSLKAESGDYKLKTPVGSIGIRGTHYEVEIVGNTIWVAVWDGAVDLDITTGSQAGSTLSLGQDEGYSYASIDANGDVTTYVEPPETFESGMTTEADEVDQAEETDEENTDEETEQSSSSVVATSSVAATITTQEDAETEEAEDQATEEAEVEQSQTAAVDQEATTADEPAPIEDELTPEADSLNTLPGDASPEELLLTREGSFTYNRIDSIGFESDSGTVDPDSFQMNMTIDFEESRVPEGNLSFSDEDGEWFATFDGYLNGANFDLVITHAAHGDNEAQGTIDANFLDGLDSIWGGFILEETLNPDINVRGNFIIK